MSPAARVLRSLCGVFYLGLTLAAIFAVGIMALFFVTIAELPRVPEPLSRIIETPPTEIFAATGERIMVMGGRQWVPLSRISPHFIKAVVATEDHRFWEHHGVDKLRTLKALYITLFEPGKVQGASTITQQLAKNLFFSFEQTYKRKFLELMVALQIEARYEKREILAAYLNQIPFGAGANGIEQAARTLFSKSAADLTLAESALLAGLPKSPARYNPYRHRERSLKRQRVVLLRMVATGYIEKETADRATATPLVLRPRSGSARTGSYFLDAVIRELTERYGADVVYRGGLKVTTTLDPALQSHAVRAVQTGLSDLDRQMGIEGEKAGPQGALVAVDTHSGAVKAMVGGRDYATSEYNRALSTSRQPGSCFKPFLYYTALEKLSLSGASVLVDRKTTLAVSGGSPWSPDNFSRTYKGPMVLKRALMGSVNTIAAQLVEKTGPSAVIETAKRCGIRTPLAKVWSVALGSSPVSPLAMASAFGTFAAGGVRHEPFRIWRVEDARGRVLEERIVNGKQTLDPALTYQVVDMMRGVVDGGSASVVRRMGLALPAAGKTGTTNDFNDAWFTGFTPNLSASVWVGHDRKKRLRSASGVGITGGRGAAPIWAEFMKRATDGEPMREFVMPAGLRFRWVDPLTGRPASDETENPLRVALSAAEEGFATAAPDLSGKE